MSRTSRYQSLINTYGMLPSEALKLSRVSRQGMKAIYFQKMLASRRGLFMHAKRYNWSNEQYRDAIKRQYAEHGLFKIDIMGRLRGDVWKLLRYYEEKAPRREDEYESPWRKRIQRRSTQKREYKYITRKQMIQDWIASLENTLKRTDLTEGRRRQFTQQLGNLRKTLEGLK